jgi:hypothetical protein
MAHHTHYRADEHPQHENNFDLATCPAGLLQNSFPRPQDFSHFRTTHASTHQQNSCLQLPQTHTATSFCCLKDLQLNAAAHPSCQSSENNTCHTSQFRIFSRPSSDEQQAGPSTICFISEACDCNTPPTCQDPDCDADACEQCSDCGEPCEEDGCVESCNSDCSSIVFCSNDKICASESLCSSPACDEFTSAFDRVLSSQQFVSPLDVELDYGPAAPSTESFALDDRVSGVIGREHIDPVLLLEVDSPTRPAAPSGTYPEPSWQKLMLQTQEAVDANPEAVPSDFEYALQRSKSAASHHNPAPDLTYQPGAYGQDGVWYEQGRTPSFTSGESVTLTSPPTPTPQQMLHTPAAHIFDISNAAQSDPSTRSSPSNGSYGPCMHAACLGKPLKERMFASNQVFQIHMKAYHGQQRDFVCHHRLDNGTICGATYKDGSALSKHKKRAHKPKSEWPTCMYRNRGCDKREVNKWNLQRHEARCEFRFKTPDQSAACEK